MKRLIFFLYLSLAITAVAAAQNLSIDEMRTPVSPGFIIMDETPASIDKPSTPKGLAFSLLNFKQGGALEFSPYWLTSHPDLTFDNYTKNNSQYPVLKNLSLSVASASHSDTMSIAVGIRTDVFRYRTSKSIGRIKELADSIKLELNEDEPGGRIHDLKKRLDLAMRPTVLIELAGAYLGQSNDGSFSNLEKARLGAWATIDVRPFDRFPGELILLARYLDNPNYKEYKADSKIVDAGARLLYSIKNASLSAEYVFRKVVDKDSFNRLTGILEYKINDSMYVTGTFGKDFDETTDIVAIFGLNIGISGKTSIK